MVTVFDTVAAVALGLLLVAYGVGIPVTLIVSASYWRSRTRRGQPAIAAPLVPHLVPAGPAAVPYRGGTSLASLPAPAAGPPATAPAFAPSPVGGALLRLSQLERQVLALREGPAPAELYARLATEAGELLGRYGDESTVGRHAAGLLSIVEALAPGGFRLGDAPQVPGTVPGPVPGHRLPDRVRVGLGRFAAASAPLPAAWAFCWLGHLPDRWPPHLPTYELGRAFAARYSESFPHGGLILPWTGRRLELRYAPTSARFGGQELGVITGLPDVAELPEPAHQLRAIGAAAVADLLQSR